MKLEQITPEQVKGLVDEELFDRTSSDYYQFNDLEPDPSYIYIGVHDPELIGFFMLHPQNETMLNFHINILKPYRKKAKEAARLFIDMFNNEFNDNWQKLTARVPVKYPEVYHFCLNIGFEDEGLCKKSIMKDGELIDQHIIGLQRVGK